MGVWDLIAQNFITQIIMVLLSLSTLIGILDYVGLLPKKIRKKLLLNKMDNELALLQEMGINREQYRRVNLALKYPRKFSGQDIKAAALEVMEKFKITKSVSVGHHRLTEVKYYYDLIGATCDGEIAEYFAHILSTYWAFCMEDVNRIYKYEYDFIVTPKGGSPILGYEFSKLAEKPFVLHEEGKRFSGEEDMRTIFDCNIIPEKGTTALIVDDSTTGGTMVCNAICDLRKYGYQVYTCLVIFEPKNKNARERLSDVGVQLVSIVETHNE